MACCESNAEVNTTHTFDEGDVVSNCSEMHCNKSWQACDECSAEVSKCEVREIA